MSASVLPNPSPKRLQFLRVLPGLKRIGWLRDVTDPTTKFERQTAEPAAASVGIAMSVAEAANPASIDTAIERPIAERVDAITPEPAVDIQPSRHDRLANRQRLPVVAYRSQLAVAGPCLRTARRPRSDPAFGTFVDKILRGAQPAACQSSSRQCLSWWSTSRPRRCCGINIPKSFLLRADRIIE
jgi:hypothetical protein